MIARAFAASVVLALRLLRPLHVFLPAHGGFGTDSARADTNDKLISIERR